MVCVPAGSEKRLHPAVWKFDITIESHPGLMEIPPSREKENLPLGVFWFVAVGVTMASAQNDCPVRTGLGAAKRVVAVGKVGTAWTTTVVVTVLVVKVTSPLYVALMVCDPAGSDEI